MTFIDLFSGIGGFRLGMEQAGHTCLGHCEIDKFANMSYAAMHKPKDGEWFATDITRVRTDDIPTADCWCFGFPCQDISVAGKQGGFTSGRRSSLFFTVTGLIRNLEEENRPSYLFIENVKNLLSINRGFDFTKLLIELDEVGYNAEWDVLNSKNFGVPQNRERVFIIGHLRGRSTREVFPIGEADAIHNAIERAGEIYETASCLMAGGNDKWNGDYIVKQVGNCMPTSTRDNPNQGRIYDTSGIAPCLNCMEGGGLEPCIPVLTPDRPEKRQNGRRFKENGEPMFTLTAQDRRGVALFKGGMKPIENALTLRAGNHGPHGMGKNQYVNGVTDGMRIRKLTPRECFRLQGVPDEYFDCAASVCSDSQLYKQAGNSVTVNVIHAIAEKMNI